LVLPLSLVVVARLPGSIRRSQLGSTDSSSGGQWNRHGVVFLRAAFVLTFQRQHKQ